MERNFNFLFEIFDKNRFQSDFSKENLNFSEFLFEILDKHLFNMKITDLKSCLRHL